LSSAMTFTGRWERVEREKGKGVGALLGFLAGRKEKRGRKRAGVFKRSVVAR